MSDHEATNYENVTLKEHLELAMAKIADEKNWGQGDNRDNDCALDTLRLGEDWTDEHPKVRIASAALKRALPPFFTDDKKNTDDPVAQFNDHPRTRHHHIMSMFRRAIEAA